MPNLNATPRTSALHGPDHGQMARPGMVCKDNPPFVEDPSIPWAHHQELADRLFGHMRQQSGGDHCSDEGTGHCRAQPILRYGETSDDEKYHLGSMLSYTEKRDIPALPVKVWEGEELHVCLGMISMRHPRGQRQPTCLDMMSMTRHSTQLLIWLLLGPNPDMSSSDARLSRGWRCDPEHLPIL